MTAPTHAHGPTTTATCAARWSMPRPSSPPRGGADGVVAARGRPPGRRVAERRVPALPEPRRAAGAGRVRGARDASPAGCSRRSTAAGAASRRRPRWTASGRPAGPTSSSRSTSPACSRSRSGRARPSCTCPTTRRRTRSSSDALDALQRGRAAGVPRAGAEELAWIAVHGAAVLLGERLMPATGARARHRGDARHGRPRTPDRPDPRVDCRDVDRPGRRPRATRSGCSSRPPSARSSVSSARSTTTRPGCGRTCSCRSARPGSRSCRSPPSRRPARTRRGSRPRS